VFYFFSHRTFLKTILANRTNGNDKNDNFEYEIFIKRQLNKMQGTELRKLEAELWRAADQLRANSKLTASEYSMPVLGLIFLRHAYNRFQKVKIEVEKTLPSHPQRGKRALTKKDFEEQNSMYLPEKSQFDYLVDLPESADIGEAIDNAMKLIEDEYDNLKGVLPKNFSIFSKDLLRELLRIFNKEVLQKAEGDLFGKIYEYFLGKFAMSGAQEGGEFFTPMSLVQTIVNVIEPDHGIVFDPACGSAGMFVQTGYFIESEGLKPAEKVTFYGQEKADLNTKLAKMNLTVHGLEGKILEGNTFYEDKHNLVGGADFVMANPPFNVDGVDKVKDAVKKDPRLVLDGKVNLPKNDNANYLWIQYFYNYLKPTGRAGFVMASSASDAGHSEKDIREKLVKTGAVDVMMAIGNNFFYTRSLPCTLWFFDRAKEHILQAKGDSKRSSDNVLMLDARKIYRKVTSKVNDFSPEQMQNIISIVALYRGNNDKYLQTVKSYFINASEAAWQIVDFTVPVAELVSEITLDLDNFIKKNLTKFDFQEDTLSLTMQRSNLLDATADLELLRDAIQATVNHHSNVIWDGNKKGLNGILLNCIKTMQHELLQKTLKPYRKETERHLKLFAENIEFVERKYNLRKEKDWISLQLKDKLNQIQDTFQHIGELVQEVIYFQHQAEWLQTRFPDGVYTDVEGLCKVVNQAAIEAKDWSLSPGRYVGVDTATDDDVDYEVRLNEIHIELDGLNEEAITLANAISVNFKTVVI
jgi:type I restriction enzyme M protein